MSQSKRFHRPISASTQFPDGTLVKITEVGPTSYLSVTQGHNKHVWPVPQKEGRLRYRQLIEGVEQELKSEGLLRGDTY